MSAADVNPKPAAPATNGDAPQAGPSTPALFWGLFALGYVIDPTV